jgi:hypothetical protein
MRPMRRFFEDHQMTYKYKYSDEALKLALEALQLNNSEWKLLADSGDCGSWRAEDQDHYKQTNEAITACEQALAAQPARTLEELYALSREVSAEEAAPVQQEPVYHLRQFGDVTKEQLDRYMATGDINPAAQREWVGLTDEDDVVDMARDEFGVRYCAMPVSEHRIKCFARAIEAKLKEKNA